MGGLRSRPDTLATATAEFRAGRDLRPRSRTVYGHTLDRLAASVGDDPLVDGFSPDVLSAFMDRWYGDAAPATWNLNLAELRSFGAYSRRQGWVASDPTAGIERRQLGQFGPSGHPGRRAGAAVAARRPGAARDGPVAAALLSAVTEFPTRCDTAGRAEEILGLDRR